MQRVYGIIVDPRTGKPVPSGSLCVYPFNDPVPLAEVYAANTDEDPTATLPNPYVADAYGRYAFSLPPARYDFKFEGAGFGSYTIPGVYVSDVESTGAGLSVGLTMPDHFTVGGDNPTTGVGVLSVTYATQVKNTILAGPTTGADATPDYRALVMADLPAFGPTASTTFGSATEIALVTTNAQGIITGISETTATPAWADVTSKPTTVEGLGLTNAYRRIYQSRSSVNNINTTAEVDLFSAATYTGSSTIGGNTFTEGCRLIVEARGFCAFTASVTKIRARLRVNGATVLVDLFDNSSQWAGLGYNVANWEMHFEVVCRATGGSGSFMGSGSLTAYQSNGVAGLTQSDCNSSPVTLSTTADATLELLLSTPDATNVADGLTCTDLYVALVGA
jgi:hypothetical protein